MHEEQGVNPRLQMLLIHACISGLLAVLSLHRFRRVVAVGLIGTVIVGVWLPQTTYGQIGFGGLFATINSVLNTINNVLRGLLNTANSILSQVSSIISSFRNLLETVIYPQDLINRARGTVGSMIASFRGLLSSIQNINAGSATLPSPALLEGIVRNRSAGDLAALSTAYTDTYGQLPAPAEADPLDRNLIDMDDAMAQGQLKALKAADAVSDQTIAASLMIEDQASVAAPGTADYLVAAGLIAAVQNQAVMQKMLAAQMRQEAARLAHENTLRKRSAMQAGRLRNDISRLLRR